jgi:hypothetical protein
MKPINYILALLVVAITSCEKEINIPIPYEGDKLVINTFINDDSLIYVELTKSEKLTQNFVRVTPQGAVVSLFENNIFVETVPLKNVYGKPYFISNKKAEQGKVYTVKATATGLPPAEGSDTMPGKPQVTPISYEVINTTPNNNNNRKVKIKLSDAAAIKNNYRIKIYSADTNRLATGPRYTVDYYNSFDFKSDLLNSGTPDFFADPLYRELIISDEQFNGKEITVNLEFRTGGTRYVAVEVKALSNAAYKYLQSTEIQNNTQGNPFAEVSPVYNNIKNGFGIVACTSEKLMILKR